MFKAVELNIHNIHCQIFAKVSRNQKPSEI